ncbi:MAG TPA: hypothetical protein PKY77_05830 [Phycisphaerae bacterium]|nr:hypothetical protein [Phycisphaerae bacterium]HRY69036.1 hypothetical protein [Phycisphaerae bacterium]
MELNGYDIWVLPEGSDLSTEVVHEIEPTMQVPCLTSAWISLTPGPAGTGYRVVMCARTWDGRRGEVAEIKLPLLSDGTMIALRPSTPSNLRYSPLANGEILLRWDHHTEEGHAQAVGFEAELVE